MYSTVLLIGQVLATKGSRVPREELLYSTGQRLPERRTIGLNVVNWALDWQGRRFSMRASLPGGRGERMVIS